MKEVDRLYCKFVPGTLIYTRTHAWLLLSNTKYKGSGGSGTSLTWLDDLGVYTVSAPEDATVNIAYDIIKPHKNSG
jgi:hypothetical protein